jgi:pSer/pThr/pTyr-binding forkhead associated (FHA) protein
VRSVKDLRSLVKTTTAPEMKRKLGPFVLIQRPPDERVRKLGASLGAQPTLTSVQRQSAEAVQGLLFQFDDLVVATLPQVQGSEELSVGRLPDCDLEIEDPSVSKQHAVLKWDGMMRRCTISDLGSTNGTTLNGASLTSPDAALKDGDVVSFGNAAFVYLLTDTLYVRLMRQASRR